MAERIQQRPVRKIDFLDEIVAVEQVLIGESAAACQDLPVLFRRFLVADGFGQPDAGQC